MNIPILRQVNINDDWMCIDGGDGMIRQIATVTALLCASTTVGAAQDLVFSMSGTDACAADPTLEGGAGICIGISASACIEATEGGYSTFGTSACFEAERAAWDIRLNAAYRALMAREKAEDAEMAGLGSAVPDQAAALKEMQRAWIKFRDTRCGYIGAQWGGGTGAGPAVVGCHMDMTGEQTLFLQQMMRDY